MMGVALIMKCVFGNLSKKAKESCIGPERIITVEK